MAPDRDEIDGMKVGTGITVCIATIPPRTKLLRRALWSVLQQDLQPESIIIEMDENHDGACATKNRALKKVTSRWVAWLDDDDYFLPHHLSTLYSAFLDTQFSDVIYAWPEMDGAGDPRPDRFGKEFDADELRRGSYIPTTSLINTGLAQKVGGFQHPKGHVPNDDHGLYLAMLDAGAQFLHVPQRTWVWNVNGQNTSGDPTRW